MKNFLIVLIFFFGSSLSIVAQTNVFPAAGNVGIGTLTPNTWFPSRVFEMVDNRPVIKLSPLTEGGLATIQLKGAYNSEGNTPDEFHINYVSSSTFPRIVVGSYFNGPRDVLSIMGNGNIGVGIELPNEKLAVNGIIRAREIKVEAANWPDYVFKPAYQLMPLKKVKEFIYKNGHLPEIPSAATLENNGISLGEMNKVLLKKVEELTLYLIEKDKTEARQQKEINLLKEQMSALLNSKK